MSDVKIATLERTNSILMENRIECVVTPTSHSGFRRAIFMFTHCWPKKNYNQWVDRNFLFMARGMYDNTSRLWGRRLYITVYRKILKRITWTICSIQQIEEDWEKSGKSNKVKKIIAKCITWSFPAQHGIDTPEYKSHRKERKTIEQITSKAIF